MLKKAQMPTINARNVDSTSEDIVKNNLLKKSLKNYFNKLKNK